MFYKKSEFFRDYNNNLLKLTDDSVTVFRKMSGAVCRIFTVGETSNIKNGSSHFVNDELSRYLTERGITGDVVIHLKNSTRNVPRWLTYKLTNEPFDSWKRHIKIFTFGITPTHEGEIEIVPIWPMTIKVSDLRRAIDGMSRSKKFDGVIVRADTIEGPRQYYMVPTRYVNGEILAADIHDNKKSLIVNIPYCGGDHITKITAMTHTMQRLFDENRDGLVGKKVHIQYSSYITGDRLSNFCVPTALNIYQ